MIHGHHWTLKIVLGSPALTPPSTGCCYRALTPPSTGCCYRAPTPPSTGCCYRALTPPSTGCCYRALTPPWTGCCYQALTPPWTGCCYLACRGHPGCPASPPRPRSCRCRRRAGPCGSSQRRWTLDTNTRAHVEAAGPDEGSAIHQILTTSPYANPKAVITGTVTDWRSVRFIFIFILQFNSQMKMILYQFNHRFISTHRLGRKERAVYMLTASNVVLVIL